jgi:hypothetical protein
VGWLPYLKYETPNLHTLLSTLVSKRVGPKGQRLSMNHHLFDDKPCASGLRATAPAVCPTLLS